MFPRPVLFREPETGVEALPRWNSGEPGNLPPPRFIPVAEQRGLAPPIGEWVLIQACSRWKRWQDAGFRGPYRGEYFHTPAL
ncbi:MAG: EAL domain-containing protein [Bryobacterales bacterium]|nr:EAL domain-containing protein [Bryobacterales bacterium]